MYSISFDEWLCARMSYFRYVVLPKQAKKSIERQYRKWLKNRGV